MQTELPITLTLPLSTVNIVLNSLNETAARAQAAVQDIGIQTQPQVEEAQAAMKAARQARKAAEEAAAAPAAAEPDAPAAPVEEPLAPMPTEQPPHDLTPIAAAVQGVDTPPEPAA
jgi:hypothetical protein